MSDKKKIYVIDRNGRMHMIELNNLHINDTEINSVEQAELEMRRLFAMRHDITFKNDTHLKVFDSKGLIGFQIVPEYE